MRLSSPLKFSLAFSVFATWASTPDITDHTIPWDPQETILRFGLTLVLSFLAFSMVARFWQPPQDHDAPSDVSSL